MAAGWPPPHCTSMQPSNTWEFPSPIPVDAFPSRGPLDVDGLFQQEFLRSPGPVNHRCVLPVDGMVASPGVLCNRRLQQRLGLACILVLPQPAFQPPLGLANVGFATAAGNPVRYVGLLFHRQSILHLGEEEKQANAVHWIPCPINWKMMHPITMQISLHNGLSVSCSEHAPAVMSRCMIGIRNANTVDSYT